MKKYVPEPEQEKVKAEILHCLHGNEAENHRTLWMKNGLLDLLDISMIQVTDDTYFWQDSIRYAGRELLQTDSISKKYLETIISQTLYYAKPEDGVCHMGVQMTVFRKPVEFPNDHHAKIIFVLAAEDQEKHLNMLNDIFKIVSDAELCNKIAEQTSPEGILYLLNQALK